MICPKCGAESDGKFCANCGAPLEQPNETKNKKMTTCKSCGQPVAKNAKTCPHCGAKVKRRHPILGTILAIIVLFIIIAAVTPTSDSSGSASTSAPRSTPTPTPAPIAISAADLQAAYDANEVSADNAYKNQTLAVTGTIYEIGKDLAFDTPYIALEAGSPYNVYTVQCFFSDSATDSLVNLRDGDTVTVIGKCTGKNILVQLTGCTLG